MIEPEEINLKLQIPMTKHIATTDVQMIKPGVLLIPSCLVIAIWCLVIVWNL